MEPPNPGLVTLFYYHTLKTLDFLVISEPQGSCDLPRPFLGQPVPLRYLWPNQQVLKLYKEI